MSDYPCVSLVCDTFIRKSVLVCVRVLEPFMSFSDIFPYQWYDKKKPMTIYQLDWYCWFVFYCVFVWDRYK